MVARYFAPAQWQATWQLGVDVLLARDGADAGIRTTRPAPRNKLGPRPRQGPAGDAA
jgi:hypothetical protein